MKGLIDAAFLNLNINSENIHDYFYKEANANKFRYQLGHIQAIEKYLKLHNPNYSWLMTVNCVGEDSSSLQIA